MMRKAAESRRWSMMSPPQKKRGIALLKRFKGRRPMEKEEKPKVERPGSGEKKGGMNSRCAVLLERKSKGGGMKGLERRLARLQRSSVKQGELQEIAPEKKV